LNTIAIIPARGGSKRIPGKNIKLFGGIPIIAYSIRGARAAKIFDRIIISTDDEEIRQVAHEHGAETPFKRPAELADDLTGTDAVLVHAIEWLKDHDCAVRYLCCIHATAPFVRPEDLRNGFERLQAEEATTAFSVTSYPSTIFRALKLNSANRLEMLWPENFQKRSQDFEQVFHDAGQFYWLDVPKYLQEKRLFSKDCVPVPVPRHLVQDIDTPEDWERAERMFRVGASAGESK
jgi:pseudaminic acid cytidylyltransferase